VHIEKRKRWREGGSFIEYGSVLHNVFRMESPMRKESGEKIFPNKFGGDGK